MRHRLICQNWPLAYGPAQGPEPGLHAHERSFRRGLASREKDQSAPRPRRFCVQPWARRAGLSAHGNAARDRPVQTRPWSKDEAGDGNRDDTEWARGQPRRVLRVGSATCAGVCLSGLLSSQKRLRGGKRLRVRSRGRPVRFCAFVLFVRAGSDAVWGPAFRRLLRIWKRTRAVSFPIMQCYAKKGAPAFWRPVVQPVFGAWEQGRALPAHFA